MSWYRTLRGHARAPALMRELESLTGVATAGLRVLLRLVDGFKSTNPGVRAAALDYSGRYLGRSSIRVWVERLAATDPDPEIRELARRKLEAR